MYIDVVTIFPELFAPMLGVSILKRAQEQGRVEVKVHNLRDYTTDKRRTVDDRPYGGGPGMVMKPEPMFAAVEALETLSHGIRRRADRSECQIVLMAPQGEPLTHALAQELSGLRHLVILCGHYEGVDERIRSQIAHREVSIGDYVLTGGELPALVLIDCVVRLIPGVLGHQDATREESFSNGLLEYPQYTRPATFRGMDVPTVLRSGDHEQVGVWRRLQALARTLTRRPDLLSRDTHGPRASSMLTPPSQEATAVKPWRNAKGSASAGFRPPEVDKGATAVKPWGSTGVSRNG